MGGPRIKLEQVLFACAVALGLILRFMNLGAAPLSDAEASWALQALDVARGGGLNSQVAIGPQPAYVILTGLLFKLFGATNFLARFWPAFAGTLLICSPFLLRKRFSREAALIAVAGMAFDPGLVTVARQAGGPMMALGFSIAALVLWLDRRYILSGILAGLALLSGPSVFYGLLALTIALLVPKMFRSSKKKPQDDYEVSIIRHAENSAVEAYRIGTHTSLDRDGWDHFSGRDWVLPLPARPCCLGRLAGCLCKWLVGCL